MRADSSEEAYARLNGKLHFESINRAFSTASLGVPQQSEPAMDEPDFAIWPPHEAFYINSLRFSVHSALASVDVVAKVIEAVDGLPSARLSEVIDTRELLDQLQNIVLQAGSVSRYFWPSTKNAVSRRRGEHLRASLGLADESPLKSRQLRNSIEHFDERLDQYLQKHVVGIILPEYVGRQPKNEPVPFHLFRGYFIDSGIFTLLGEEVELSPLVDALYDLNQQLELAEQSGGRLRKPRLHDSATDA